MSDVQFEPPRLERWMQQLAARALRLLGATWRFRHEGDDAVGAELARGAPVVLYSWHNRLLIGAADLARYAPLVMISQSRDGARIAGTVEQLGFQPVRGSSSRGGARALLELVRRLRGPVVCCHLVDGPRGPLGEVKPGLILLGQRSGALLIPVYYSASHKLVARSWDRMQLPLPFARIVCRHGSPRRLPKSLSEAEFEELRRELERDYAAGSAALDAEVAGQA